MKNAMKCYINPIDFQHDIWKLAKQIFDKKWQPDIMIALWRGGANVGVGVYEFLSF
jgi:hypoxanthine phosphoribosyltransferase